MSTCATIIVRVSMSPLMSSNLCNLIVLVFSMSDVLCLPASLSSLRLCHLFCLGYFLFYFDSIVSLMSFSCFTCFMCFSEPLCFFVSICFILGLYKHNRLFNLCFIKSIWSLRLGFSPFMTVMRMTMIHYSIYFIQRSSVRLHPHLF